MQTQAHPRTLPADRLAGWVVYFSARRDIVQKKKKEGSIRKTCTQTCTTPLFLSSPSPHCISSFTSFLSPSDCRADSLYCGRALVLVLGEVLLEQLCKAHQGVLILDLTGPSTGRHQEGIWHPLEMLRHVEAEDRHSLVLALGRGARVNCVNHQTRILERNAFSGLSVCPSHPACVDQPRVPSVVLELCCQHLRVHHRVPDQERSPETGREGR
mmetsp:Transcript_50195/g.98833  ORF Transcript_50195/g.98833 Transcript_50195/m.98833 type:complete len:213 (-) Transcript_50195:1474-2112(-)